MEQIKDVFLVIYTRFVLRDVMGKMIPGCLALMGAGIVLTDVYRVASFLHMLTKFELLFFAGLGWNTTLFLQSLGDWTTLIPFTAKDPTNFINQQIRFNKFLSVASEEEKAQHERQVVVKEASGNTAMAIVVVLTVLVLKVVLQFLQNLLRKNQMWRLMYWGKLVILVAFFLILFDVLRRMSLIHKRRQGEYPDLTVREKVDAE